MCEIYWFKCFLCSKAKPSSERFGSIQIKSIALFGFLNEYVPVCKSCQKSRIYTDPELDRIKKTMIKKGDFEMSGPQSNFREWLKVSEDDSQMVFTSGKFDHLGSKSKPPTMEFTGVTIDDRHLFEGDVVVWLELPFSDGDDVYQDDLDNSVHYIGKQGDSFVLNDFDLVTGDRSSESSESLADIEPSCLVILGHIYEPLEKLQEKAKELISL